MVGTGSSGRTAPPIRAASSRRSTGSTTAALGRLLKPSSIAFVGLSDNSAFLDTVSPTFDSDAEIFMVNPRYESVAGRPTAPSLTSLDRPIDAVMCFMSAERTTDLVEEAAGLDVGGLVLVASGFAELDTGGEALQARIRAAAWSSIHCRAWSEEEQSLAAGARPRKSLYAPDTAPSPTKARRIHSGCMA